MWRVDICLLCLLLLSLSVSFASPQVDLRVLLFGDSLTKGFLDHGTRFHPYAIKLKQLLDASFTHSSTHVNVYVEEYGLSGDTTKRMASRLADILHASNSTYDLACVLGGTNDLAFAKHSHKLDTAAQDIFSNLQTLYSQLRHAHPQIHLVVLTVPQSFVKDTEYITRRGELNRLIKAYAVNDEKHTTVVDLEALLPFYDPAGQMDVTLWSDGLHFSANGYDTIGQLVFNATEREVQQLVRKKLMGGVVIKTKLID